MRNYENPINFEIKQFCEGDEVLYKNLLEIGQGGPVIGDLYINGRLVAKYRFGGPLICSGDYIYVPAYIKRFFNLGFRLTMINRSSLDVKIVSPTLPLIFLEKIENNQVFYFEDVFKNVSNSIFI